MNIFKHELKTYLKPLLWWSIGMLLLIYSSMAKFATYQADGMTMNKIMESFPKSIQAVFGMYGVDLSKASSCFGAIFLYIVITAGIHAAILGSDIIAKEERDRTAEFLFIKPITRKRILLEKILAAAIIVIIFNVITTIISVASVNKYSNEGNLIGKILSLMIALLITQFIFAAIGFACGSVTKKSKTAATIPVTVLLVSYIILVVVSIIPKLDFLKYISPLNYFEAQNILKDRTFSILSLILSGLIIAASTAGAFKFFRRKDLG